jgi:hypothetical protein
MVAVVVVVPGAAAAVDPSSCLRYIYIRAELFQERERESVCSDRVWVQSVGGKLLKSGYHYDARVCVYIFYSSLSREKGKLPL